MTSLRTQKTAYDIRLEQVKENKIKKEAQLDAVAIHDKHNAQVYRGLSYVEAMYDKWTQGKIQESYFKRLVDLYAIAAIVGLKAKRRSLLWMIVEI